MRVSDLNEAGFANFADQAVETIDKLSTVAGAAYNKFKTAKDKAEDSIKSDIKDAQADAKRLAQKAAQAAENEKKKKKGKKVERQQTLKIPMLIAKAVVTRSPDSSDMIEEFHTLDAAQFNEIYTEISNAKERLAKFPRELRKALKASDFLQDSHRTDDALNDMLGEQSEKKMDAAGELLIQNAYDEQDVWIDVLTQNDVTASGQQMVGLIKAISRGYEAKNLADASKNKGRKDFPEGTGVVRIISSQRQLIDIHLDLLRGIIEEMASKPISEAALRRVRKLLERMK